MGRVQVGTLFKKRTIRKLDGSIYEMLDEADGGVIISKGQVVNQDKVNEIAKKEADRRMAAQAQQHQTVAPAAQEEIRAVAPTKVEALEKKVEGMETDIKTILALLQKK